MNVRGRSMRAVFAAMRRMWSSRPLRLRVVPNFGERCCRPEGLLFQGRHNAGVERGEQAGYREYRDRFCAMARSLFFEGHIAWAEAIP